MYAVPVRRACFPYAPLSRHALGPLPPYLATAWRRECRGAAAHSSFSAVSRPSCEGMLPLRLFSRRILREGRRSGIVERAASATPPYTLRALPPRILLRLGGGVAEVRWLTAFAAW